jgi:putative transposase
LPEATRALRALVEPQHETLSVRRQCALLGLNRAGYYYQPATESAENLRLLRLLDEQYLRAPFYGSRRMSWHLRQLGYPVNRKRVQRLMRVMGLEALAPKPPKTRVAHPEHRIYPYLLRDLAIERANQVWSADITYIPMRQGFMYLFAILDWYSRYLVGWSLSNSLETSFCLAGVEQALAGGVQPEIFNTDQGCQFTSREFTNGLARRGIQISRDGRGRCFDNIFIERFWRSLKYEDIYLKDYQNGWELDVGVASYAKFYNEERPHQGLGMKIPHEVHYGAVS